MRIAVANTLIWVLEAVLIGLNVFLFWNVFGLHDTFGAPELDFAQVLSTALLGCLLLSCKMPRIERTI